MMIKFLKFLGCLGAIVFTAIVYINGGVVGLVFFAAIVGAAFYAFSE